MYNLPLFIHLHGCGRLECGHSDVCIFRLFYHTLLIQYLSLTYLQVSIKRSEYTRSSVARAYPCATKQVNISRLIRLGIISPTRGGEAFRC